MLSLLNELQGQLNNTESALMFARATHMPNVSDLLIELDKITELAAMIRDELCNPGLYDDDIRGEYLDQQALAHGIG